MCALISFKFLYQFSFVGGVVIYKQLSTKEWRKIRNKSLVLNLDRNSLEVYCVQNPSTLNVAVSVTESITMFTELTLILHNNFHTLWTILKPNVPAMDVYCSALPLRETQWKQCSWFTGSSCQNFESIRTFRMDIFLPGLLPANDCAWQREQSTVSVWQRTL